MIGNGIPAQTAMNGQSMQSDWAGWSGQQGMPSGMSADAIAIFATANSVEAASADGIVNGARTSPSQARAAKR
jgi:hypothetical protein